MIACKHLKRRCEHTYFSVYSYQYHIHVQCYFQAIKKHFKNPCQISKYPRDPPLYTFITNASPLIPRL